MNTANPSTRTFTRDYLCNELDLPRAAGTRHGCEVISDDIDDTTRWSVMHTLIFRLDGMPDGEAWMVGYSVGATEMQDESPWENEKEVEATLVRRVERVVLVWEVPAVPTATP